MSTRTSESVFSQSRLGESRFGEARHGESRFQQSRFGMWVDGGRDDGAGRISGAYRSGTETATLTDLTIVRAGSGAPAPAVAAPPAAPTAPRALSLPGGRNGVLLFHGLSSTPLELQYLARGLHRAGYTVRVAVIEGYSHGLPSPKAAHHRFWAAAAVAEFDRMRKHCDALAVGGLCIGSLLSLHVAASRPHEVSHVLALSTALRYDGWAAPWTRFLLPLARVVPWMQRIAVKEREPYGLKDERLRAWIAAQMKESGGSDAGAAVLRVKDLLEAQNLMGLVRSGMPKIVAPTLVIHAKDDDAASIRSAHEVEAAIRSPQHKLVVLDDSYHMISIDKEKAKVLSEMKSFLEPPAAPAPANPAAASTTAVMTRGQENVKV